MSMSMTQFHRRVLDKAGPELLNDLDCDDILPYLVSDEAVSKNDVERICAKGIRRDKVASLLDLLPRRGDGAYVSLLNGIARIEGSQHLYEVLKKCEDVIAQQRQDEIENERPSSPEGIDSISMPPSDPDMISAVNQDVKVHIGFLPLRDADMDRQPRHPNKVLNDPDLLDLAQELGEHWEMLALNLGMSRAVIYQCKENNRYNTQQQIFEMLYKWKCSQGKKATVSAMLKACKKIKLLGEDAYKSLYDL
nr:death domain-containing protein CRADD-like [Lytechinus pictus]